MDEVEDEDVARLVQEERIAAAATLASARGDARTASELFERACEWRRAAEEAVRAGDDARALPLAIVAEEDALAETALERLVRDSAMAARVAGTLERRGEHRWAARVLERTGQRAAAAKAWEKAGEAVRSAEILEELKDAVGAARVLEAAVRRTPTRWENHLALGRLLLRYGKTEAAVRALQPIPEIAPERPSALGLLAQALGRLGFDQAATEAARELARLGGAPDEKKISDDRGEIKLRLFGRYDVVREVASTATARVLQCTDAVRAEVVALKVFAGYDTRGGGRDVLARFEREVKVLGALDHPNVVPLRDYFPDGPALVLGWMSGGTLETMIEARSIAPARAIEIACAVLSALGEAHRLGVLHRDIKPANVLFDAAGVARLGDFGVAHLGDLSATATAGLIGTLAYMSPEQREGRPATVRSDLYGVGAILFEMLTGERLATDGTTKVRPSGVHRDLAAKHDAVVLALVAQDPADRPADAFVARRSLTALPWPSTLEPAAPRPLDAPPSQRPPAERLETSPTEPDLDRWTGRAVERVPVTPQSLARAGAFARAGHVALQTVLRVNTESREIWLAHPLGRVLDRPLKPAEIATLREAIEALHAAGAVHGKVDRAHVFVGADELLTLRFVPEVEPTATMDLDRIALPRLAASTA